MSLLKKRAYDHVWRMLSGEISPGTRLSAKSLAKQIGISHTPVREALIQLQSEGLIEEHPQKGLCVRQPDRDELVETIELRTLLEVHAAGEAARRVRDAEIDELERHINALHELVHTIGTAQPSEVPVLLPRWAVIDLAFHRTILTISGNSKVIKVVDDMRILTQIFGFRADDPTRWDDLTAYYTENYQVHRDVFEAISRRDAEAARSAMAAHMHLARRSLLLRFDSMQQKHDVNDPLFQEYPESLREQIRALEQPKTKKSK